MKTNQNSILMYGHDEQLLATSQWVLQSRGYRVVTMVDQSGFQSLPKTPPIQLLLLCHTLSPEERDSAFTIAQERWPGVKSLILESSPTRSPAGILGQLLHTFDGPGKLVSMVAELIGASNSLTDPPSIATEQIPPAG